MKRSKKSFADIVVQSDRLNNILFYVQTKCTCSFFYDIYFFSQKLIFNIIRNKDQTFSWERKKQLLYPIVFTWLVSTEIASDYDLIELCVYERVWRACVHANLDGSISHQPPRHALCPMDKEAKFLRKSQTQRTQQPTSSKARAPQSVLKMFSKTAL